jgi:hypothetical protein
MISRSAAEASSIREYANQGGNANCDCCGNRTGDDKPAVKVAEFNSIDTNQHHYNDNSGQKVRGHNRSNVAMRGYGDERTDREKDCPENHEVEGFTAGHCA